MHELIFQSLDINGQQLKNRTVVAPMTRVSTSGDGVPTQAMAKYYQGFARGGFALIITEGAYTDRHFAQAYPNQPGITSKRQAEGWAEVARQAHAGGAKIVLQLMHAGALSQHLSHTRSASSIQPIRKMMLGYSRKSGKYPLPQAMNLAEIDQAIEGFVQSAKFAQELGFDGVEIHGANGYLLDQFLTEYTNDREDAYGASVHNRVRLLAQVIASVKAEVLGDFIVGARVSQGKVNDHHYKWPGGVNDGEIIFNAIEKAGADYIHFAGAGGDFKHGSYDSSGRSLPQLAKTLCNIPIMANGGLDDLQAASHVLQDAHADLIAIGTGALANPDWPNKVLKGQSIAKFSGDYFKEGIAI